ncbi:hypothetical protein HHK36_016816 [Tetracentron sinense]|uniref:Uncharacterized protein n=1 Tax=Tetracentron sinense TaxID=13715 RepID=A0A835DC97_TETSI|nr:hypothetical protein HHK36_016816 [Tetracentron sinense]
MIRQNCSKLDHRIPAIPSEPNNNHECGNDLVQLQDRFSKNHQYDDDPFYLQGTSLKTYQSRDDQDDQYVLKGPVSISTSSGVTKEPISSDVWLEDSRREKLKRHRIEVAGRVWIPDIWGQEELLMDCSAFDASLVPRGIMLARAALVEEGRRANSGQLKIGNRC